MIRLGEDPWGLLRILSCSYKFGLWVWACSCQRSFTKRKLWDPWQFIIPNAASLVTRKRSMTVLITTVSSGPNITSSLWRLGGQISTQKFCYDQAATSEWRDWMFEFLAMLAFMWFFRHGIANKWSYYILCGAACYFLTPELIKLSASSRLTDNSGIA